MMTAFIGVVSCVALLVVGYVVGHSDGRRVITKRVMDRLYKPGRN